MSEEDDAGIPPQDGTPPTPDQLADMEFDLPVSEEVPPDEVQARLEEPRTLWYTTNPADPENPEPEIEKDAVTAEGVTKVFTPLDQKVMQVQPGEPTGQVQEIRATEVTDA
jgi:hypothetical protein